jgi:outer membrane receptor protein involved in Fe transport
VILTTSGLSLARSEDRSGSTESEPGRSIFPRSAACDNYREEFESFALRVGDFCGAQAFGQLESMLGDRTRLTVGARLERHRSDYLDSAGVAFAPDDNLSGWRLSLDHAMNDDLMAYVTLARGYKAGGFNTDGTLPPALREFEPETLLNLELGLKGRLFGGRLQTRVALFNMAREDLQISSSRLIERDGGSTEFISFTGNAAEGTNRGIEAEFVYSLNAN